MQKTLKNGKEKGLWHSLLGLLKFKCHFLSFLNNLPQDAQKKKKKIILRKCTKHAHFLFEVNFLIKGHPIWCAASYMGVTSWCSSRWHKKFVWEKLSEGSFVNNCEVNSTGVKWILSKNVHVTYMWLEVYMATLRNLTIQSEICGTANAWWCLVSSKWQCN